MSIGRAGAGILAALAVAGPVLAADSPPPALDLPITCAVGTDCWVVNYVDLDPSPDTRDYACGKTTYDGHKGVDFAIRDLEAMAKGVPVLAAAAGTVEGVRDGMADLDAGRPGGRAAIAGRECGNGVLVDHGGGWTTQYCHLRLNSVRVKKGDRVEKSQTIGMVGHSGLAEFPHVHIQLAKDGRIVDPFVGLSRAAACGLGAHPLWSRASLEKIPYKPTAVSNVGFAQAVPKEDAARSGLHSDKVLSRRAPVLILWTDIFWVDKGDILSLRIVGPDGATIVEHSSTLDRKQARRFAYAGRKKKGLFWDVGKYTGEVKLTRKGEKGAEEYFAGAEIEIR